MQLSKNHPDFSREKWFCRIAMMEIRPCQASSWHPDRASRIGMVGVPGVEPGTSSLSGTRSNQLSYTPFFAPLRGASKGKPVRLLRSACHAKLKAASAAAERSMVEAAGFEPATPSLQSSCSAN